MKPFHVHTGIAALLIGDNIDTDQIIPSREMKTVSKTGLAMGLFAGQRYIEGRVSNPDFILNTPKFESATILLSGKNFGCGSSREHAVWALKDFGFRAVIAESFGDIFYNNCVRNGILPIHMNADSIAELGLNVTIDLPKQTVDGVSFDMPAGDKKTLIEGLDMIDQTLEHKAEIDGFFENDKRVNSWKY